MIKGEREEYDLLFSGALHPGEGKVPKAGGFLLLHELCPVFDALSGS